MSKLRNPELYRRLCAVFGRKGVVIRKAGQAGEFGKVSYEYQGYQKFKTDKTGTSVGEEYAVSCPLGCGDTRGRLAINHLWGTEDKYTGKRILWLCHCYNEDCQADYENRKRLSNMIFGDELVSLRIDETVNVVPVKRRLTLPGTMLDILSLAKSQPGHPAVQFAYAKGYDIEELSTRYGVGYCGSSNYGGGIIEGRLVAPWYVTRNGKSELAGWTARRLREDIEPKWCHSATATGGTVYGLGEARQYHTIVVGEGPGDKWGIGGPGCATLGKGVSTEKAKLIAGAIGDDSSRLIVVLQDPDQDAKARAKGKPHHIEQALEEIRKFAKCPTIGVYLPSGTDPGGLERSYIWDYIYREAKGQGVKASNQRVK